MQGQINARWSWLIIFCVCASTLLSAQVTSGAQKPQLVANKNRYRQSGLKLATGRSGSAELTARALRGADGQTQIELTTGQLDSAIAPPGNIGKVQVKPLDQLGEAITARNLTGLTGGGYFSLLVSDLARAQQVQLQANITGIDPKRTNVVTVVETVKMRPDPAIRLDAPATGPVNVPLVLGATVTELNGDAGATADCVLYVDGAEADRAVGFWIDAAGAVSCGFSHVFTRDGRHQLEVKVENVVPGDFNAANNSASGAIEIVTPRRETNLNFYAYAYDEEHSYLYRRHHQTQYAGTIRYDDLREEFSEGWQQAAYVQAWASARLQFPFEAVRTDSSDGTLLTTSTFTGVMPNNSYQWNDGINEGRWEEVWVYNGDVYLYAHTHSYRVIATGEEFTYLYAQSQRWAGDITYYSRGHYCYWWQGTDPNACEPGDYYAWNYSGQSQQGVRLDLGSQYTLDLVLNSADGVTYRAHAEIPLSPYQYSYSEPYGCYPWVDPYDPAYSGNNCYGYENTFSGKQGWAADYSNP